MVPFSCSKQARAVTSRRNSSSSLGGPGSAQGGEDNQSRGRVSQKDLPSLLISGRLEGHFPSAHPHPQLTSRPCSLPS